MAKQKITGPYRVQPTNTGYELVEVIGHQVLLLRPPRIYTKEKRTSAYRAVALLNRKWQAQQSGARN